MNRNVIRKVIEKTIDNLDFYCTELSRTALTDALEFMFSDDGEVVHEEFSEIVEYLTNKYNTTSAIVQGRLRRAKIHMMRNLSPGNCFMIFKTSDESKISNKDLLHCISSYIYKSSIEGNRLQLFQRQLIVQEVESFFMQKYKTVLENTSGTVFNMLVDAILGKKIDKRSIGSLTRFQISMLNACSRSDLYNIFLKKTRIPMNNRKFLIYLELYITQVCDLYEYL